MRFTTSLLESDAEITQLILKGLLSDVQKYMSKVSKKLEPEIKSIVKEGFMVVKYMPIYKYL
jgi:hypothetical protein